MARAFTTFLIVLAAFISEEPAKAENTLTSVLPAIREVKLNCLAGNGLKVETQDSRSGLAVTTWAGFKKDFHITLQPSLGAFSWVTLTEREQPSRNEYQILLFGNALKGETSVLSGAIGRATGMPFTPNGSSYPAGFTPVANIACEIFWND